MDEQEPNPNSVSLIGIYVCVSLFVSFTVCAKVYVKERLRRRNFGIEYDIEMGAYNFTPCFNNIQLYELDEDDKICSICLEDYEETDIIYESKICKHHFHFRCVNHWLNIKTSCPLCREDVLN